jgi:hypothetical protein
MNREDLDKLLKDTETEMEEISASIQICASSMTSAYKTANVKHVSYLTRHRLVDLKRRLMQGIAVCQKDIKTKKKNHYDEYKFGIKRNNSSAVVLKNDYEREIYLDNDVKSAQFFVDILDSNLDWVVESLKTMDNIIYGISHVIALDQFVNKD